MRLPDWLRRMSEPFYLFPKPRKDPDLCPRVGCEYEVAVRPYDGTKWCPEHGLLHESFQAFIDELVTLPDEPDTEQA